MKNCKSSQRGKIRKIVEEEPEVFESFHNPCWVVLDEAKMQSLHRPCALSLSEYVVKKQVSNICLGGEGRRIWVAKVAKICLLSSLKFHFNEQRERERDWKMQQRNRRSYLSPHLLSVLLRLPVRCFCGPLSSLSIDYDAMLCTKLLIPFLITSILCTVVVIIYLSVMQN